jgi:hypothetical protein
MSPPLQFTLGRKGGALLLPSLPPTSFFLTGKVSKDLENSFQRWMQTYKEDPKEIGNYN